MNSKNSKKQAASDGAAASQDKNDSGEDAQDAEVIATFDEGERRPTLESPDQGGLRAPAPIVSADPKDYVKDADKDSHTEATMPPAREGDPKRNTM